jgi:hypothetical protein
MLLKNFLALFFLSQTSTFYKTEMTGRKQIACGLSLLI